MTAQEKVESWRRRIKIQLHEKLFLHMLIVRVPSNNNAGDLFTDICMFFSFAFAFAIRINSPGPV